MACVIVASACGQQHAAGSTSAVVIGPLGDTWTGDDPYVHQEVTGPSPRYSAAIAYDAPRHDFLLFGGQTAKGTSDETWKWDGKKWTPLAPAHKPPARRSAAMAYDPRHGVVVLYGGLIADQFEGTLGSDTWTWDGRDWTEVSTGNTSPGPRRGHGMATAGDHVLMFGGRYGNARYFADAWTWDGANWSRVDHDPTPPGRDNAAVTWNPADSSLFLYGGGGINVSAGPGAAGTPLGDGWWLKDGRWTQLAGGGPPALALANAIWDQKRGRVVVMFGMDCPNPGSERWAWARGTWSPLPTLPSQPRWGAAVAQDTDGRVLIFGGSSQPGC